MSCQAFENVTRSGRYLALDYLLNSSPVLHCAKRMDAVFEAAAASGSRHTSRSPGSAGTGTGRPFAMLHQQKCAP